MNHWIPKVCRYPQELRAEADVAEVPHGGKSMSVEVEPINAVHDNKPRAKRTGEREGHLKEKSFERWMIFGIRKV